MLLAVISKEEWLYWWQRIPDYCREVYWHPDYYEANARWEKAKAECLHIESREGWMMYPFLRHPIVDYALSKADYFDIQSAYGYGGPLFFGEWQEPSKVQAYRAIEEYLKDTGVVAEFIRCHPEWIDIERLMQAGYDIRQVRTNVEIELAGKSPQGILGEWNKKVRYYVRKAQQAGLQYTCIGGDGGVAEFVRLYNLVAERLCMTDFYRFDEEYIRALFLTDKKQVEQILIYPDDISQAVASQMMFYGGELAYCHLMGVDKSYGIKGFDEYLMWICACRALSKGCSKLSLGGGRSMDPNDSLFCFKKKLGSQYVPVYIGGRILDKPIYESLCNEWKRRNLLKASLPPLFLQYRA